MSDTDRDYKAELQSAKQKHLLFMSFMLMLLLMSLYRDIVADKMYHDLKMIIERDREIMDLYNLRLQEEMVDTDDSCLSIPSTPSIQEPQKESIEL